MSRTQLITNNDIISKSFYFLGHVCIQKYFKKLCIAANHTKYYSTIDYSPVKFGRVRSSKSQYRTAQYIVVNYSTVQYMYNTEY